MSKFILLFSLFFGLYAKDLNIDDAFFEKYAKNAPNAKPIMVRDTDSPKGRYNLYPKTLDIKTIARFHGHFCDGLVLAYVELTNALKKLFPNGVIDRTDLRVVSKNSPCLVDTSSILTGARINHKTLSLDNSLGGAFIIQQISTKKAYKVELADKSFLKKLKAKEKEIDNKIKNHQKVNPKDIDEIEALAFDAMKYMLFTNPDKFLKITELKNYKFKFNLKDIGKRSDVVNKNVKR